MRLLGQIIVLCLVLSALQGLAAVLAIAIILCLFVGLLIRPEQTMGLIALGLLFTGFSIHPWITIGIIGLLFAIVLIADAGKTATTIDVGDGLPVGH